MSTCVVYCAVLATAGTCDWQLQRDVDGKSFLRQHQACPQCNAALLLVATEESFRYVGK